MTLRRRAGLAVLALLVVIAAVLLLFRTKTEHRTAEVASVPPSTTRSEGVPRSGPAPEIDSVATGAPSVERLKEEMEKYRQASIYPHWSIPLTADMEFALKWNDAVTDDLALDNGVFVRFEGNAGRVFAGEPYTAWIKAWRTVNGERRALPVHVTRAAVSVTSGPKPGEAFDVIFNDDGLDGDAQARDGVVTTRFIPSERTELSLATMARIEAYVEIDGQTRQLLRDFVFAPRPVLEVRGVHDKLRDGSLVVTLDCEVYEDGVYTFYANLMAQDGTPIAMTKLSYPLKAGRRTADLTFFGKVIYDRGVDGPYVVRDIHGLKRVEDGESNVWWSHPGQFQTNAYKAHQLSDAEWNDPERLERLANFERVIKEMEGKHAQ